MNQDCFPSQKPNSERSSGSLTESKRRRLAETPINNMFRPTPGQSALVSFIHSKKKKKKDEIKG